MRRKKQQINTRTHRRTCTQTKSRTYTLTHTHKQTYTSLGLCWLIDRATFVLAFGFGFFLRRITAISIDSWIL